MSRMITQFNDQSDVLVCKDCVENLVLCVLDFRQVATDELIIHFVDVKTIISMHLDFFGDANPTDCISFPIDKPGDISNVGHEILGEIFVCPMAALRYSQSRVYDEISLYIVHGILHLLGYCDENEKDKHEMVLAEDEIMTHLRSCNLILRDKPCAHVGNSAK